MRTATSQAASGTAPIDVASVAATFPALQQSVNGHRLVYLDNAATTQKPQAVLDALLSYYEHDNANVHRGVHQLSQRATQAYEASRDIVRRFLNAPQSREIVFVRGTTEAVNLVAQSWGRANIGPGDEVLITQMEHHSNIVPWQLLCAQTGATLNVVPIDDRGVLRLDEFERLLSPRTKLAGMVHVSNALGTVNPVQQMCAMARAVGAITIVDGAQAAPHLPIDVQAIGCDFYAISGHKMYAPTGIGALFGRLDLLDAMPPWQGGGEMIKRVSFEGTTYNDVPHKFEAGTPNIGGAIALGAAATFLLNLGLDRIGAHEHDVLEYGTSRLAELDSVRLIGTAPGKAAVLSFIIEGVHPHDIGTILDDGGVAVRTGHHCAQPVMDHFGVPATARASLGVYNSREDIDELIAGIQRVIEVFG